MPAPWQDQDIGGPGIAGGASYASGVFTVKGGGADIWNNADAFNFVYQPLNGDGTIVARVISVQNTDAWAKAGVMIRETLGASATFVDMMVTPGSGLAFQYRQTTGGNCNWNGVTGAAPAWVKLTRSGSTFTAYSSTDGSNWSSLGSTTINMAAGVYIGLAVTAHNNGLLNTSTLDNVTVTAGNTPPPPPSPPVISSATTASGTVGQSFSYQIAASNSPTSYNATNLPAGLSVNTSSGAITGTPTTAGASSVTISATNAGGTGTATLSITISAPTPSAPVISSATTASGTVGQAFSYQITASNSPTSYNATNLPAGLSVNTSNGAITGTPTTAGTTSVTISAMNAGGTGTASLSITINAPPPPPPPSGGTGLRGDYFSDQNLTTLTLTRTDATVNFNWGSGSPDPAIPVDHFSIRWTGQVKAQYSETYTFYTQTDDGVRLWINGQLLVDKWIDQGTTEWSGTIALTAGQQYNVKMEYYENAGGAVAILLWSSASTPKAVIPQAALFPAAGTTPPPNQPPTVSLTSPANNATFTAPASITIAANAADSDGTVAKVDFYNGATLLGTATASPYSITWSNVAAGSYSLTAKATDNSSASTTSAAVNITVNAGGSGNETVWVEDALPAGSSPNSDGGDSWNWVSSNPAPFSGAKAWLSAVSGGEHQLYFSGASAQLAVNTGDRLFAYVYLDPANLPGEVMLQWNNGSWEHRAYWGANTLGWGSMEQPVVTTWARCQRRANGCVWKCPPQSWVWKTIR